jgi:transposase
MFDPMNRYEVTVLRKAGHSQRDVADLSEVSVRTVQRLDREARTGLDPGLQRKRGVGRPSKVATFADRIRAWLDAEPELESLEILRRAREDGYDGGKTALCDFVRARRPPPPKRPVVRFEGVAGEFSQHDFGEADARFVDGSRRRVHFFASRLKWSRVSAVSLVPNERVEALVRAMVDHFGQWGGIPLLAVFDRPKTIASEWSRDGKVTRWNPTFQHVAFELGLAVELCWPYQPQQKGSVENLVGWVQKSFFKTRRFIDEADLHRQLAAWLDEVNTRRPSRATNVIPAERMAEEKARLRPLKVTADELALPFPVRVGPTAEVAFEGRSYSLPPEAIGLPATLYLKRDAVRIVAGRHVADHPRIPQGPKSVLPAHRAAMLAHVSGRRGRLYLKRQQLFDLGPALVALLTEIVHRRPNQWWRDVEQLHRLLGVFGDVAVVTATKTALAASLFGAEYVEHFLGLNLAPPQVNS